MDGIRILGEWAHQYNQMTEGMTGEHKGHWDIDEAMAGFKDIILECPGTCRNKYEMLIPKFKSLAANKQYEEAKMVGMELNALMVSAIQERYPDL